MMDFISTMPRKNRKSMIWQNFWRMLVYGISLRTILAHCGYLPIENMALWNIRQTERSRCTEDRMDCRVWRWIVRFHCLMAGLRLLRQKDLRFWMRLEKWNRFIIAGRNLPRLIYCRCLRHRRAIYWQERTVKESMNWKLERIPYCITAPRMVWIRMLYPVLHRAIRVSGLGQTVVCASIAKRFVWSVM